MLPAPVQGDNEKTVPLSYAPLAAFVASRADGYLKEGGRSRVLCAARIE
jgi:hypothetical protein